MLRRSEEDKDAKRRAKEEKASLIQIGDVARRELLTTHEQAVRSEVERFGGRIVDTAGDGVLAVFDSPVGALRCASAIRAAARLDGLRIRAGVDSGEAAVGNDVRGVAVHEAARIMASAAPDEILVSETIPALVSELGLEFDDRGEHDLNGGGSRRLLAFSG